MNILFTLSFLVLCNVSSFAQQHTIRLCKVEFYLLKNIIPNTDTTSELKAAFTITKKDLADTAFIKNEEIISFTILKNRLGTTHRFRVSTAVTTRINNLHLPLCCGQQFALVMDEKIIYTGYFWNILSSFGCNWITASAYNNYIDISRTQPQDKSDNSTTDPRKSIQLLNCFKHTKQLPEPRQ